MRSILSLSLLISLLIAQEHAGYAGSYYENGIDARSISMGNALTAGTDLYYPAYFNPADIATNSNRKVLFGHQFLSLDRRQSIVSLTMPLPPVGGFSVGWIGSGVNNIQGRDLTGKPTDNLSASENMFIISFGIAPVQSLQIGGSVKILQNQLPNLEGTISANGVGFDFGAMYAINRDIIIALVLKNINAAYQWSNKLDADLGRVYKDKFPIQLRSGVQYSYNNIVVVGDIGAYFIDTDYLDYDYRFGAEYNLLGTYSIRSGYRSNRFSFGFGIEQKQFEKFISNIDYAFVIEPVGGLSHIISYALNF